MKKTECLPFFASAVLLLALVVSPGCEGDKGSVDDLDAEGGRLTLSPSEAELQVWVEDGLDQDQNVRSRSENIQFTVAGGAPPYRWHLANPGVGTLTSWGNKAVFSPQVGGNNILVVTDKNGNSASAAIVIEELHVDSPEEDDD